MTENLPGLDALGCGYDILNGYADPGSVRPQIFNFGKLKKMTVNHTEYWVNRGIEVHPVIETKVDVIHGETIEEYCNNLGLAANIEGTYGCFSGSLETKFFEEDVGKSSLEYTTLIAVRKLWTASLPVETVVKKSVQRHLDGAMSAEEILDTYGAYYLNEVVVGGRIEFSASTTKVFAKEIRSFEATAKAAYNSLVGPSISAEVGASSSTESETFNRISNIKVATRGGDGEVSFAIGLDRYNRDAQTGGDLKDQITQWARSITNTPVFVDFTKDSLKPIWALAAKERQGELEKDLKELLDLEGRKEPIGQENGSQLLEVIVRDPSTFTYAGTSREAKAKAPAMVGIWKPGGLTEGDFWVCQYAQGNWDQPRNKAIVVRPLVPGAVAPPESYEAIWGLHEGGHYYSCWRVIPPVGYKALGHFARFYTGSHRPPHDDEIAGLVCVHESLVVDQTPPDCKCLLGRIWKDEGCDSVKRKRLGVYLHQVIVKPGVVNNAYNFYGANSYKLPVEITSKDIQGVCRLTSNPKLVTITVK